MILLGRWIRDGEGFLVDNLDHELFTSPNIRPIRRIILKLLIIPQPCYILIPQKNTTEISPSNLFSIKNIKLSIRINGSF
jgi:hypothetical protein